MKYILSCFLLVFGFGLLSGQQDVAKSDKPYHADLVMGPYLILDGTIYESVFLTGMRLGYEYDSGLAIGIEYLAGNQEDLKEELGTTHSAFGTLTYYTKKNTSTDRFRPYFLLGGGFFEFKDFSADVLGVAFYLGAGLEMNINDTVKGFLEPRYVNLGLMDANGTHQLGVMWGVRGKF